MGALQKRLPRSSPASEETEPGLSANSGSGPFSASHASGAEGVGGASDTSRAESDAAIDQTVAVVLLLTRCG
jgi:hypothetical protein